jgi:[acyl-carrier-protein] S-malonyltransferase
MIGQRVAFVFSGQGSQTAGMLDDAIADAPFAREILARADARLGTPLSHAMRTESGDALFDTTLAQPALLTIGVLHALHLRAGGLEPGVVIGHSVGQFAALVTSGALDFDTALEILRLRARLMVEAMPPEGGAMAAILGLDRAAVYAACRAVQAIGVVGVACHNAPDQTVISGARAAVDAATDWLEASDMSVVPLAVSVATHSALLRSAVEALTPLVMTCPVADPQIPVIDNVTARPLENAGDVRRAILQQLVAPVLFEESVQTARALGATRFVQCGPGDTLLRCVRRQFPDSRCLAFREAFSGTAAA